MILIQNIRLKRDKLVGTADVTAGSGSFTIVADELHVGSNTVKITSEASENFTAGEANVTFNVTAKPIAKVDPNLLINVGSLYVGEDAVVHVYTNTTFSGIVKVDINGSKCSDSY
jgi:hypothetical protein